jgi:hypothetical protein
VLPTCERRDLGVGTTSDAFCTYVVHFSSFDCHNPERGGQTRACGAPFVTTLSANSTNPAPSGRCRSGGRSRRSR